MTIDVGFLRGTVPHQEFRIFSFSGPGFKVLIDSGLFKLPHKDVSACIEGVMLGDVRAIDLKENREKVRSIFLGYRMTHAGLPEMTACVDQFEYLLVL